MAKKRREDIEASSSLGEENKILTKKDAKRMLSIFKDGLNKKWEEPFKVADRVYDSIPTGSLKLDNAIGNNGIVIGRCHEFFGEESSGKTSLATTVMANAQKKFPNRFVGMIDVEHAFNEVYAQKLGLNVDDDEFVFTQPSSAEEALDILIEMVKSGIFSVVTLDSVAALRTKRQIAGEVGDATIGELARLLSQNLSEIVKWASKTHTTVLFINQVRMKIVMYGDPTTTPGGSALPFYCSTRLHTRRKDIILASEKPIGQTMAIRIRKNKVGPPYATVETALYFGVGFNYESEAAEVLVDNGFISQAGAWFYYKRGDPTCELKFQGKKAVVDYLLNNRGVLDSWLSEYQESILPHEEIELIVAPSSEDDYITEEEESL
jgi:recombination protein RecA